MLIRTEWAWRDCRIAVHRGGEGAPVLVLHGAGGAGNWLRFLGTLAAERQIILPEHPGFDGSTDPDWLREIGDLAYFYLDFIRQWDLRGVHLVGHSLGGWIACELAIRSSASLASLTLISSAGIRVPEVPPGDNFIWSAAEAARNLYADSAVADRAAAAQATSPEAEFIRMKNRRTAAKLAWSPRWHNPALARWLDRIDVPTRILWGDSDGLFPPAYAEAFGRLIPGATVTILPRCGHVPHLEQPAALAAAITEATRTPPC